MHIKLKYTFQELSYSLVKEYGQTCKARFSLWLYLNFPIRTRAKLKKKFYSLKIIVFGISTVKMHVTEGLSWGK